MKILITGAAGFIGYHTAKHFLNKKHRVYGYDTFNDYYDVHLKYDRFDQLMNMGLVNTGNFAGTIENIIEDVQPDLVIHLGAYAGVRYSLERPDLYIENNVVFTQRLIQSCEKFNIKKVIYASTSSVYAGNGWPWVETMQVDGQLNPYSASKRFNEQQFRFSKIPTTIGLRFFTVYGPWGRPDMALFSFTKSIVEGKPITLFNNGDMIRDFTYIDDIVQGISIVSNHDMEGHDIFNIGYGRPARLMDFVAEISNNLNRIPIVEYAPMHPADTQTTWSDTTKLQELGYKPTKSIKEGVAEFVTWYKSYYGVN
jgi:UDP-glucuronate 4-epimerase